MPAAPTKLTIRYFAWVRERVGREMDEFELPESVKTVTALVAFLRTRGENYERAFAQPDVIRVAINQAHVKPDAPLANAREVAFFPPVTGG